MHRFFVSPSSVGDKSIIIEGSDAHHISNVLRMKRGEKIEVCTEEGIVYTCTVKATGETVEAEITDFAKGASELPVKITLFQCLPKKDKMELVIQKAVELGVHEIIPVISKRTVVKTVEKRTAMRVERWNAIAKNAAEQSGRGIIPAVGEPVSFKEALIHAERLDARIMPYENAGNMEHTRRVMNSLGSAVSIGVMIGPEGGFADDEVNQCREAGFEIVTLGKRILRTETAGIAALSILMFVTESGE